MKIEIVWEKNLQLIENKNRKSGEEEKDKNGE